MADALHRCLLALALTFGVVGSSTSAWAGGVEPGKASEAQRDQAQARFLKGRDHYGQSHFAEALEEFRASHEIVASPNARLFSARCLRELGRVGAAYAEFGRAEAEAREHLQVDPRYARTGESASEERRALAPKVGFVTFRIDNADASTTLRVSGEPITRAAWGEPFPVATGTREVVVETKGRPPLAQSVTVGAGETKPLLFDAGSAPTDATTAPEASATPPPTSDDATRKSLRTASYIGGGVGVAGLATFAIFGALSNGQFQDLKTACKNGPCPPARQSDIDAGRREQTIANVGLAIGLIGVAAGVTLFLVSSPRKSQPSSVGLLIGPGGLGGAF